MATMPAVFVSAVSGELKSFRGAVCDVLLARKVFPLVQEGFPTDHRKVVEMLTGIIAEADAVICLVGFAYGCEPRNVPAGQPRRSYTQLEYHIARELGKPVYVFLSDGQEATRDAVLDEEDEKRRLQLAHREAIQRGDHLWHGFASKDELSRKVATIEPPPPAAKPRTSELVVAPTRLRHYAEGLFGRDGELARLNAAWANPKTHVVTIVAWGGVGKTSLVARWLANMAEDDYRGAERVFDWTFYSQGTREQGGASADLFVSKALEFFGDPDPTRGSAWDKGERLARLVSAHRSLLVLDGLEPLQYPPGVPGQAGKLKDPAIECLLKGLAQHNRGGLCIVTTRQSVTDLTPFRETTAPEWQLENLPDEAGAQLLHRAGVNRAGPAAIGPEDEELKAASREVHGHALTLTILGGYLARAHGGDIRRRDRVEFQDADARVQGGHAFRALAAYERWLASSGEEGQRQLALLRLMGFFDRPADPPCLAALCEPPAIPGLTEPLIALEPEDWNCLVADLATAGLLHPSPWEPKGVEGYDEETAGRAIRSWASNVWFGMGEPAEHPVGSCRTGLAIALGAHPLVRAYFASELRQRTPSAWIHGHARVYEHLTASVPFWPEGADGLQPLYQAVAHGCHAGLHQKACDQVYRDRILRGAGAGGNYSWKNLGLFGADLGAVACFFERQWTRLAPALSESTQAWLLSEAATRLRALGRITEAIGPMTVATDIEVRDQRWTRAAVNASILSGLELTLGEIAGAVRDGEKSLDLAERSGDALRRMINRTTLAHALHEAGRRDEALNLFREAEDVQVGRQVEYRRLHSLWGFRYCDLLVSRPERAAWRRQLGVSALGCGCTGDQPVKSGSHGGCPTVVVSCREVGDRATQTLHWAEQRQVPVEVGLDHLTLGRAMLYEALFSQDAIRIAQSAIEHIDAAVDLIRAGGQQDQLPRALLTRAWVRSIEGDAEGARDDLDEAWMIAERGPMRLHMADTLLHRARLFMRVEPYPWPDGPKGDLAAARKLIEECGYHRRDEELADAEAALRPNAEPSNGQSTTDHTDGHG